MVGECRGDGEKPEKEVTRLQIAVEQHSLDDGISHSQHSSNINTKAR